MTGPQEATPRRIERRARLPGGRAVVGALLITTAALAVFAAYLDATGDPSTRFVVAREEIPAGTVVTDLDAAERLFGAAPLALVEAVAERAFAAEDLEALVGRTIVAPLAPGELLQRGAVHDGANAPERYLLSFAVPAADAVAGNLAPGEPVDILTTSRDGPTATTSYVVRGVPVVAIDPGSGTSVTVTVALEHDLDAQALGHAVQTAGVFLVRALGRDVDGDAEVPAPYQGSGAAEGSPVDAGSEGDTSEDGVSEDGVAESDVSEGDVSNGGARGDQSGGEPATEEAVDE